MIIQQPYVHDDGWQYFVL